ncbi:hypothetical protein TWF694_003346 [Orbilia ellipsospora]|uniref:Uncharacterized protein n=1 Tax=Orbilia ellipsospora TaxID=2528407 RepID=A0AAV9X2I5_9PEZI
MSLSAFIKPGSVKVALSSVHEDSNPYGQSIVSINGKSLPSLHSARSFQSTFDLRRILDKFNPVDFGFGDELSRASTPGARSPSRHRRQQTNDSSIELGARVTTSFYEIPDEYTMNGPNYRFFMGQQPKSHNIPRIYDWREMGTCAM